MFLFYLKLRWNYNVRLLKGLGIIRSLILLFMIVLAVIILCKVKNEWVLPVVCSLLLVSYHNIRRDKEFLANQISNLRLFLQKEYFVVSLFFILITLFKGDWLAAVFILAVGLVLPYQKHINCQFTPIKLGFLYHGNMEYIRMFRRYWWIYLSLVTCSILGSVHGNMRIAKVCMILGGFIQSDAYNMIPNINMLTKFKSYRQFQYMMWKSTIWNVVVLSIPFILIVIAFDFQMNDILFVLFYIISCIFYVLNIGLLHLICNTNWELLLFQLCLFLPIFFFSCFIPFLNIIFIASIGILSYVLFDKLKSIWK